MSLALGQTLDMFAVDGDLFGEPALKPALAEVDWTRFQGRGPMALGGWDLNAALGYRCSALIALASADDALGGMGRPVVVPRICPKTLAVDVAVFGCAGSALYYRNPRFIRSAAQMGVNPASGLSSAITGEAAFAFEHYFWILEGRNAHLTWGFAERPKHKRYVTAAEKPFESMTFEQYVHHIESTFEANREIDFA